MTRAARRLVLLAALTAALVGLAVGPASAHDELIATDRAVDSTVEQAPTSVTLTFRAAMLRTGAAIEVSGPDGALWSTGDVGCSGATVNREMRSGAPADRYAVAWRVVAADGHPVSGQFGFTVSVGPPPGTPITSPAAAASPVAAPSEAPTSAAPPGSAGVSERAFAAAPPRSETRSDSLEQAAGHEQQTTDGSEPEGDDQVSARPEGELAQEA